MDIEWCGGKLAMAVIPSVTDTHDQCSVMYVDPVATNPLDRGKKVVVDGALTLIER